MLSIDEINKKIYDGKRRCEKAGIEPARVMMSQTSRNNILDAVPRLELYPAYNEAKDEYNGLEIIITNIIHEDAIVVLGNSVYGNLIGLKSDFVDLLETEVSKIK